MKTQDIHPEIEYAVDGRIIRARSYAAACDKAKSTTNKAQHSPQFPKIRAENALKWKRERDHAQALVHAQALAEALRDLRSRVVAEKPDCLNTTKADETLRAWEAAQ